MTSAMLAAALLTSTAWSGSTGLDAHAAALVATSATTTGAETDTATTDDRPEYVGAASRWRVVLDGVMGGLSSGRVADSADGRVVFAGDLRLENNGGFSQIRRTASGADFADAEGVELTVRGDGRTYDFDIRVSNVRMMAGGFQQRFDTTAGEWTTVRLPFDDFRLYSFGRLVRDAPAFQPRLIESLGVTLADKNPGDFRLELASIKPYGGSWGDVSNELPSDGARTASASGDDLVTVARSAGLTTLLELVTAADFAIPSGTTLTVFAPTNDAFAALPRETVQALLAPEGRDTLRSILAYHVASPALDSASLLARRSVVTLNGQRLEIDGTKVGNGRLLATDVPFDGGVVHVVDSVLMPSLETIADLLAGEENLSTLRTAVQTAGLTDQLGPENGDWTVFAPVNSAFAKLPEDAVASLLRRENREALVGLLGLHVVPGRLSSSDLLSAKQARTFFGTPINFELAGGSLQVNGASFVATDIETANGVVHLIDQVLMPAPEAPASAEASTQMTTTSVRAQRRAARDLLELAIGRGAPLFNNDQPAACAAVYEIALESLTTFGTAILDGASRDRIALGLANARTEADAAERAWILRRAIDAVFARLMAADQMDL